MPCRVVSPTSSFLQDGSEFYTLSEDFSKKFEKEFAKVKYDDGGHGVSDDV